MVAAEVHLACAAAGISFACRELAGWELPFSSGLR